MSTSSTAVPSPYVFSSPVAVTGAGASFTTSEAARDGFGDAAWDRPGDRVGDAVALEADQGADRGRQDARLSAVDGGRRQRQATATVTRAGARRLPGRARGTLEHDDGAELLPVGEQRR